jgi:PhzF family phenazine biosynthesis protein
MSDLYRLAAFTTTPVGGNPAGVWIGDALPATSEMQRIAAEVGFSETAFLSPRRGLERTVRYYSPAMEVPFCGHATIAAGVLLGELDGEGTYRLHALPGEIPVRVHDEDGQRIAALTSVTPSHEPARSDVVLRALELLDWSEADLDPAIPPARAYAGASHLVLAARRLDRLAELSYDFEALRELMTREGLVTLQLVHRESLAVFHSRNPFPVGGVVEDPATGASAAALGGYLRDAGILAAPASLVIRQGEAMGRPSVLRVEIPVSGGIIVSGTAVHL